MFYFRPIVIACKIPSDSIVYICRLLKKNIRLVPVYLNQIHPVHLDFCNHPYINIPNSQLEHRDSAFSTLLIILLSQFCGKVGYLGNIKLFTLAPLIYMDPPKFFICIFGA